jgi:hypothetical protein
LITNFLASVLPNNYEQKLQAGREKEYLAMEQLRKQGYSVARTAGSHGPFDVIAILKST